MENEDLLVQAATDRLALLSTMRSVKSVRSTPVKVITTRLRDPKLPRRLQELIPMANYIKKPGSVLMHKEHRMVQLIIYLQAKLREGKGGELLLPVMLTTLDPTLHVCRCRTCLEKRHGQTGHELIDDDLYHDEDYVYPEYQLPKHPATTLANLDDFVWPVVVCTGHYRASHGFPRQHHQPHWPQPPTQISTLALA